jgi:sulfite reductase (NADPH) hemoprotein beta-component
MIGKVIRPFLPKADLLPYVEAILSAYNLLRPARQQVQGAHQDHRARERLDAFRELVEARFAEIRPQFTRRRSGAPGQDQGGLRPARLPQRRPTALTPSARRSGVPVLGRHQPAPHRHPDYAIVTVSLKAHGATPGDATSEQMRVMADLAERYGHDEMRISHEQNVILPHVHVRPARGARRPAQAGLGTANVGLISDIIACPGMDYCALATARSIPVAQEIARASTS